MINLDLKRASDSEHQKVLTWLREEIARYVNPLACWDQVVVAFRQRIAAVFGECRYESGSSITVVKIIKPNGEYFELQF